MPEMTYAEGTLLQVQNERIAELEAKRDRLAAENAELRKDRERVVFLVHYDLTYLEPQLDANDRLLWGVLNHHDIYGGWVVEPTHTDWRGAADALMASAADGGEE